jgi:hypothetical protein
MEAQAQGHSYRERLLSALGGLLTIPENGQPTLSLALGVHAAAGLAASATGEVTPASIAEYLSVQRAELPEPMPNPFCDLLVTARGHAVARCAHADDSVRDAELLIASVLAAECGECERVLSSLDAGLALMSELADRCDWQPYEAPGGTPDRVEIPDSEQLAALPQRVLFDAEDLRRICGSEWEQTLAPLILRDRAEPGGTELESRPLVPRSDGGLIVARPDVLAPALACALAQILVDGGHGGQLNHDFHLLATTRAFNNLAELGPRHYGPAPKTEGRFSHSAALFPIDADVLLHLLVLPADVEAGAFHTQDFWIPVETELIPAHLAAVEEGIREEGLDFATILHLIVLEGGGALPILPLDRDPDLSSQCLVFTGSEFEWLCCHPEVNSRDLVAFAHDATDLRLRVAVKPVSQFDEFATWHAEDIGLLAVEAMAVEAFETVILGAGPGAELRAQVLERYSPRMAPAPDNEGWWRIARHLEYLDVDIWRPWGGPDWPPHMLVPGVGAGTWVLAEDENKDRGWDTRRKWTELIAYWLWRLREQLPLLRAAAEQRGAPLVINLAIEVQEGAVTTTEDWAEAAGREPLEMRVSGEGAISVLAHPEAADLLGGPSADPEHELILRVVRVLCEAAGADGFDTPTLPEGLRKLVYMDAHSPAMRPVPVPEARVHSSYRGRAYRRAGTAVSEKLGVGVGLIAEEQANDALHTGVRSLFVDLEGGVEELDGEHTVPLLVAIYERLLHSREIEDTELVAIDEFFGHHADTAAKGRRRWQELMGASVACRFLLEVAAARPPSGDRPPSDNRIQELLAMAMAIEEFGKVSDLIEFELTKDPQVAVLPPGLLRARSSDMIAAHEAFSVALRRGDVGRSAARRTSTLNPSPRRESDDQLEAEIDAAYLSDHGFTIDDIGRVLGRLIEVPEHELGFTEIPLSQALQLTREDLPDPDRADRVIEALMLRPRAEFLKPPDPFKGPDVYPWRHNRPLSYIRRPLIVAPGAAGEERLLYGRGACFGAVRFLLTLASTGRLGAEGSALRGASIKLQQREARDLEEAVAAELKAHGWACRTRVENLPGVALARENGDDLGDIDVLAADPDLKLLACFEAKSLAGALAPRQLRNELDATFAPSGKRPSAAVKFTERAAIIRANAAAALKLLNIDSDPEDWQTGIVMVSDPELLSPLLDACPVPVISLEQLRSMPDSNATLRDHLKILKVDQG